MRDKYWVSFSDATLTEGSWWSWMLVFTTRIHLSPCTTTLTQYAHTEIKSRHISLPPVPHRGICYYKSLQTSVAWMWTMFLDGDDAPPAAMLGLGLASGGQHAERCCPSLIPKPFPLLLKASWLLVNLLIQPPYIEKDSVHVCERKRGDL